MVENMKHVQLLKTVVVFLHSQDLDILTAMGSISQNVLYL